VPERVDLKTAMLGKTADDLIRGSLKASPSYRAELGQKTYAEIIKLSQGSGTVAQAAKGMKKLEQTSPLQDSEAMKFTGHERDTPFLDYMHARSYLAAAGRFLSVDPNAFWELQHGSQQDRAKFRNYLRHPQRWNLYAYVSNNPINKIDPDGREENFYTEQLFREQQMVGEGKMTEEQCWARRRSEGYGALIGTAGAGGWLLGARLVTTGYTAYQAWRAASASAATIKLIEQASR
jgi:RHS repeat-associated protein